MLEESVLDLEKIQFFCGKDATCWQHSTCRLNVGTKACLPPAAPHKEDVRPHPLAQDSQCLSVKMFSARP